MDIYIFSRHLIDWLQPVLPLGYLPPHLLYFATQYYSTRTPEDKDEMTSKESDVESITVTVVDHVLPRSRPPIGELLKTLRGERTLREVERDTGIPNSYLSNLELGLKNPGLKTLTKLSEFYEVPLNEFLSVAGMPYELTIEKPEPRRLDIMRAYKFVVADPDLYQYQSPYEAPAFEAQKYIVQLYEHFTGKKLL